jgi:uncharacterized protein (DUF608 family)
MEYKERSPIKKPMTFAIVKQSILSKALMFNNTWNTLKGRFVLYETNIYTDLMNML